MRPNDMGRHTRRLHIRMPFSPLLLHSHHIRQPQEIQVYLSLWLPCHTIRPTVETNRRGYEAAGQRDYIPGGCGTDVALQL